MKETQEDIATGTEKCTRAYLREMRNVVQLLERVQTVPPIDIKLALDAFANAQAELLALQVAWREAFEIPLESQRQIRATITDIVREVQEFEEGLANMRGKMLLMQELMDIVRASHSVLSAGLFASAEKRQREHGGRGTNVVDIGSRKGK